LATTPSDVLSAADVVVPRFAGGRVTLGVIRGTGQQGVKSREVV
jgi:hypothetical protein